MHSQSNTAAPWFSVSGFVTILLCFCALPFFVGCGGGPREFVISSEAYRGPELAVQSKSQQHLVIMQAPTPGWIFSFDASRPQFGFSEVFLTVTRPNPAFVYTQAMVTQEVGTEVSISQPIVVYARVLAHDVVPDAQAYSRAAASAPAPGSSPPSR